MAHRSTLILVLALASVFVACDKAGIHPLGREIDVVVQCEGATSTWIRSIDFEREVRGEIEVIAATEVFIIGADDIDTLDARIAQAGETCFHYAVVEQDSNTNLWSGELLHSAEEGLVVDVRHHYLFPFQPNRAILQRLGARRDDLEPTIQIPIDFAKDGEQLLLEYEGEPRRLTRLGDVIARLNPEETDPDALGGPKDIYRMFNLALFVGQPRIPAFGGAGMTAYDEKAWFAALIEGEFSIVKRNIADIHIEYFMVEELDGVVVDGPQITLASLTGSGTMTGILTTDFYTDPDDEAPYFTATVDYEDLKISNGMAGDGFYTLITNPGLPGAVATEIDYTIATDEDFAISGLLPVEEGVP